MPAESLLARQFGVNRSTVREGIRQLENEGLVRREGRKRLCVTVPDQRDLAPRVIRTMVMHQVTFGELWDAALVLEPACASLCAENRNDDQAAKHNILIASIASHRQRRPGTSVSAVCGETSKALKPDGCDDDLQSLHRAIKMILT